jgi:SAM-dependent methyltransferase
MNIISPIESFVETLLQHLQTNTLEKIVFHNPKVKDALKSILMKPTLLGDTIQLQAVFKYPTKEETKIIQQINISIFIEEQLTNAFRGVNLFVEGKEFRLLVDKKNIFKLFSFKYDNYKTADLNHDRTKSYLIESNVPFLTDLGISNASGILTPSGSKKFKQINKFLEIIASLVDEKTKTLRIVDVGSGSGYLTFALCHYLISRNIKAEIIGVELRQELVEKSNHLAKKHKYSGLSFIASDIFAYDVQNVDILIALHACDIATDIAIAKGIKCKAANIVVAPCCQKQIRKSWKWDNDLNSLLRNGIMEERMAEMVTDTIRSLILQREGYKTKVFEFVPLEHTQKNVIITAEKSKPNLEAQKEIDKLKVLFGIGEHYLEGLV